MTETIADPGDFDGVERIVAELDATASDDPDDLATLLDQLREAYELASEERQRLTGLLCLIGEAGERVAAALAEAEGRERQRAARKQAVMRSEAEAYAAFHGLDPIEVLNSMPEPPEDRLWANS